MGCGFCAATFRPPNERVTIRISREEATGIYRPVVSGWIAGKPPGTFLCPGAEMDMPRLALAVFGREPPNPWLGETIDTCAAYSCDAAERMRAASGGVVPAMLRFLFDSGRIVRAFVLSSEAGARDGCGREISNPLGLATAHGSHYHPFDFGAELGRFLTNRGPFAFVGLPCQVAAMRQIALADRRIAADCVMLISLFCGGINSFQGVGYYLRRFGIDPDQVSSIRYREGAWPGRIRVELRDGSSRSLARIRGNSRYMVMHYMAAFQGFWMSKRCRICPDQVGDFADISVGDPHSPRFRRLSGEAGGGGFSAVVTRTSGGDELFRAAVAEGYIARQPMSADEVVDSQGYTLRQRRHADAYAAVDRRFGGIPPSVRTYAAFAGKAPAAVRRIAYIDLAKLKLAAASPPPFVIWLWQAFEYLFLRFPADGLWRRLAAVLRNR